MRKIKLSESISRTKVLLEKAMATTPQELDALIGEFVEFSMGELGLEEPPIVEVVRDGSIGSSFGCYTPGTNGIKINPLNRHPVDILRTLAHEMVHFKQDMDGELHEGSGETGSEHENEANSVAGILMRNFGRANPQLFSRGAVLEGRRI